MGILSLYLAFLSFGCIYTGMGGSLKTPLRPLSRRARLWLTP